MDTGKFGWDMIWLSFFFVLFVSEFGISRTEILCIFFFAGLGINFFEVLFFVFKLLLSFDISFDLLSVFSIPKFNESNSKSSSMPKLFLTICFARVLIFETLSCWSDIDI